MSAPPLPGRVIVVYERGRRGWLQAPGLPAVLAAPARAARAGLRDLWRRIRGLTAPPSSEPDNSPRAVVPGGRQPVLLADGSGTPRCVARGRCAVVCPTGCIDVAPLASQPHVPERFEIDLGCCMFCGWCERVCPEGAIALGPHLAAAVEQPTQLRTALESLLWVDQVDQ